MNKFWLLFVLSVVFMCTPSFAETVELPDIVVTPYRYGEGVGKVAASVKVLDAEDIRDSRADSLVDVLRSVDGITVRDYYGNATKSAVDMGGFGEQSALNVLVLVDGRRANNVDLSGVDWTQVPLDQVERIEIIRGSSGAVIYGDNASGGVINIITKRGGRAPAVTAEAGFGSYSRNSQKLSVAGGAADKLSYWLSSGHDSTRGYRQNSFSRNNDFAARLDYRLSEALSLHSDAGFHASSYGIPGALYQDNIDTYGRTYARFVEDHANNKDYYGVWGLLTDFAGPGQLGLDLSYRQNQTDSYFLSSGNPTRKNRIRTYGLTPKYTLSERVGGHDNKLVGGVDYYQTFFDSDNASKTTDVRTSYTNIKKTSVAGYVQDEFALTDRLTAVGGYRREAVRYAFGYHDFGGWNPDIDDRLRPKMQALNSGLVYQYAERSQVFANIGRSYRFPEVDEFTFTDENYMQQLKTSLKPQSSVNYQAGVRHNFSEGVKAEASLFRMDVKDELFLNSRYAWLEDPWSPGTWYWSAQNDNYDRTVHQGLETSAEARVNSRLKLRGGYTFTDARFSNGAYAGNEIPLVARHKASAGLGLELVKGVTLDFAETYVGARRFYNDQANAYSRLNGYLVTDAGASWRMRDWTVSFGVNNLLNAKYSEVAGVRVTEDGVYGYHVGDKFYFPSPERNYNFKVSCVF
ncbi:MAG: TonB-dependent receptor [Candidatus Omnitrophica bacterium]|nr:TonB-dependent receptor [Candidatus Omnitrophota bacterium]